MPTRINSAYRLHNILEKATKVSAGKQTAEVWWEVFSVPDGNPRVRNFEVARLVNLLAVELDEVRAKMKATSFSEQLYQNTIQAVERVLVVDSLTNTWENYRQFLRPEVLQALLWCAEALGSEEELIDENELSELKRELEKLEKEVLDDNLPDVVKNFVLHHVGLIKRAIAEYPIVGIKAFTNARYEAIIDIAKNGATAKESAEQPAMKKLSKLWGKVKFLSDKFGKTVKFLKDVKDAAEIVSTLIDAAK